MTCRSSETAEIPNHRFQRPFVLLLIILFLSLPAAASLALTPADVNDESRKLVKEADRLIRKGKLDEAQKLLKQAIEVAGTDSFPKLKLAQLYVKQRRLIEAYELAFPIAKAEPKNSYAFAVLGMTMLGAGRFRDSRALFISSIMNSRRQALGWAGLGMLDFYENRIDESLANLEQAVYYDPSQADYLFAYAQVSARAEKYKAAADAYLRFLAVANDTDDERRARIKGLISFLNYLGNRPSLYATAGADKTTVPITLTGNRPLIKLRSIIANCR
jgi:tetratricopeptide (TPR) repeat protein